MAEEQSLIRDRYRLLRLLSRGGQGTAYLAEDTSTGAQVVAKVLRMGDVHAWAQVELFEREARVLKGLSHPSIPRYVDSFESTLDGQHAFVLVQEYVAAPCLEQILASGWRGSEADIRDIGARLLAIVAYIHSLRPPVVHRDITPRNVLRGEDGRVTLVDFGGVQDRLEGSAGSTLIGTPGYVPPEQVLGQATERSDLYAAAMTLLTLFTHREPFELPMRDGKPDLPALGEISAELSAVLQNYLEPDQRRRTLPVPQAIAMLEGRAPVERTGRVDQPYGSRIGVRGRGERRVLVIPERGPSGPAAAIGGFALFWLAFVAFWTFSAIAMGAPVFFPLFSIPFWCVGLFMVYRALNGFFGSTDVELAPGEIAIVRRLLGFSRRMAVPLDEVAGCRVESAGTQQQGGCVLEAGALSLRLGGSLSQREQQWLCDTINAHLDGRRTR